MNGGRNPTGAKKERVGDFKNDGRVCRPQGDPEEVRVHAGWVSVGVDHDTAG